MSAHTPGPWIADALGMISQAETGNLIAQTWDKCEQDFDNADANARLIAAAPRMLDVLRALVSSPAMVDNDEPLMVEARAILRDVEGKSNG